jgi:RHS repeat-associated protein
MRKLLILLLTVAALPSVARAQTPPETIEYYGTDMLGSIRIVFRPDGATVARQDYAPFGRPLFPAPAMPREGFGGQEKDDETNQGYFHARMFQARTGRFSRPDPVSGGLFEPQGWNRYAYALNSPVSQRDFSGLCPEGFGGCFNMGETVIGHVPGDGRGGGGDDSNGDLEGPLPDPGGGVTEPAIPSVPELTVTLGLPLGQVLGLPSVPVITPPIITHIDIEWWKGFATGFLDELRKRDGCARLFFQETGNALIPWSMSASTFGDATATYLTATEYNRVVRYAASRPNHLGGTGLINANKSKTVQRMMRGVKTTSGTGPLLTFDLAIGQGFVMEMYAMRNGDCR